MRTFVLSMLLLAAALSGTAMAEMSVQAIKLADGLVSPITAKSAADDSGRLFVVDQVGQIWILQNGRLMAEPFLDVSDRLVDLNPGYDERGLLGLAFHPQYQENGRFYVFYSAPLRESAPDTWDHTNVIAEFRVSESDPNMADAGSERILLEIDHPQGNHNGGTLEFGPDGYLYISEGDGGGANDVGEGHSEIGNGQDVTDLLGNVLRIDVDGPEPYGIPSDNPFVDADGRDEIFAYGLRNPYRFSFDRGGSHEIYLGDAGQDLYEEVNIITLGGNYGWRIREGFHCFNPDEPDNPPPDCPDTGYLGEPLIAPILEFPNTNNPNEPGLAVTVIGGYVYRGQKMPTLEGDYIFGGFSRTFEPDGILLRGWEDQGQWNMEEILVQVPQSPRNQGTRFAHYIRGFGEDSSGEVYVMASDSLGPSGRSGKVFILTGGRNTDEPRSSSTSDLAGSGQTVNWGSSVIAGKNSELSFSVPRETSVELSVFDVAGRQVRALMNAPVSAGLHEASWDGRDDSGSNLPSGVYFFRLATTEGLATRRVILTR